MGNFWRGVNPLSEWHLEKQVGNPNGNLGSIISHFPAMPQALPPCLFLHVAVVVTALAPL